MNFWAGVWHEVATSAERDTPGKLLGRWIANVILGALCIYVWESVGLLGLTIAAALQLAVAVFFYGAFKESA